MEATHKVRADRDSVRASSRWCPHTSQVMAKNLLLIKVQCRQLQSVDFVAVSADAVNIVEVAAVADVARVVDAADVADAHVADIAHGVDIADVAEVARVVDDAGH